MVLSFVIDQMYMIVYHLDYENTKEIPFGLR